jgi:hypothetical protein
VDLDQDGRIDLLSGSYSRMQDDMAGLFQVLWGGAQGFSKARTLTGTDGEPLLLRGDEEVDRICTRPFAADLDGDGDLDLVAGNFRGKFAFFRGEGKGAFAPEPTWLQADGEDMAVNAHGDPFLVDWDADGDLDLVSGSAQGGAFHFTNLGSRGEPRFGKRIELLEPAGYAENDELGDAHLRAPSDSTRLWVEDLDGDGKLDLCVGDNVTLYHAVEGVSEAVAKEKLAAWRAAVEALSQEEFAERYEGLEQEREAFVREDRTGFVWVYYRK